MGNFFSGHPHPSTSSSPAASISPPSAVEIRTMNDKLKLLQNHALVLLVYSNHCAPCIAFKPQFNAFVKKYGHKYKSRGICHFAQESISLNLSPNVRAIPTLLFFKRGSKTPFLETHGNMKDLFKGIQQMTRM